MDPWQMYGLYGPPLYLPEDPMLPLPPLASITPAVSVLYGTAPPAEERDTGNSGEQVDGAQPVTAVVGENLFGDELLEANAPLNEYHENLGHGLLPNSVDGPEQAALAVNLNTIEAPPQHLPPQPMMEQAQIPAAPNPQAVIACKKCGSSFGTRRERKVHERNVHQGSVSTRGIPLAQRSSDALFHCCIQDCQYTSNNANSMNSHLHPSRRDSDATSISLPELLSAHHTVYWRWFQMIANAQDGRTTIAGIKTFATACRADNGAESHKFVIVESSEPSGPGQRKFCLVVYKASLGLENSMETDSFIIADTREVDTADENS
ncbi:hypothetical protein BJ508DRAFT_371635 [Ascobolus immersus RN42]|uniref:C2H2-type domain-containing protein n=1 Tax=Ascobolus immersus RN42 TaxID=1160509 RepID=A0A3N4IPS9_ASCIM|nr:hypothetical protein BJ508DRAFT_371635 [Ascobolus immersus RN42]